MTHRKAGTRKKTNCVAGQPFMRAEEMTNTIEMMRFGTFELMVFR